MSVMAIDCALVTRTQAGDEAATDELAAQARPIAQRYASRFFADQARAEDLAQTAMMKAFARVRDVRTPEAFQGWLLRITRNECLNELARQRVAQVPISTLEEQGTALEAPAGGEDDPEEALVRVQMQSLVRQVITTLPSHYRRTLTMRALEDRTYDEISEELDIPLTVARLWYCRARKRFRQAFVAAMVARRDVPAGCRAMGGDIAEMIEGTLSRADRDRVQAHLADCHVCRQTEDELLSTAFRAPSRGMLLCLGMLGVPRRLTSSSLRALKAANVGARLALGLAGTATALAVAGAPSALASPAQASSNAAAHGHLPAAAGPAGAAGRRDAGLAGSRAGARTVSGSGAGSGLPGSLDVLANTVDGLAPTLSVGIPAAVPDLQAIVHNALRTSQPALDGAAAQARTAAPTSPAGASLAGGSPAPAAPPVSGLPVAPPPVSPGH